MLENSIGYLVIDVLDWLELHPGLAMWAQAFGVILVLWGALTVSHRLARTERDRRERERRLKAQALAVVVHPSLAAFDDVMAGAIDTAVKLEELALEPPRVVVASIPVMWRLGPAGALVLRLISGLEIHRQEIAARRRLTLAKDEYDHFFTLSRDRLKALRNELFDARDEVALLLEPANRKNHKPVSSKTRND